MTFRSAKKGTGANYAIPTNLFGELPLRSTREVAGESSTIKGA